MKNVLLVLALFFSSCGDNVTEGVADRDPIDNALADMDNGRWDEAIEILEDEIGGDEEPNLIYALLALAYAGKHGLDPLTYSIELTKTSDDGDEEGNAITNTFAALPEATDENIAGIKTAADFMALIPNDEKSLENVFLASMLYSAHFSLISKKFNTDGDAGLTAEELAGLSADEAAAIIESLLAASDILSGTDLEGGDTDKAAEQIDAIQDAIDDSEGATDQEKLQNFLSNQ
ncbi:hypothetical protein N9D31_02280 [Oligoflexaceae bacterium]|nr:hypothetical protein [Oligoflexaceae bacterium]